MKGKNRCKVLKDIRRRIAEENGITYVTTECKYKGDCLGTCPKCESEVKYLERELERKRGLGKKVAVAGIAAGITLSATGCTSDVLTKLGIGTQGAPELEGDLVYPETSEVSTGNNCKPEESAISEIFTKGEMVEIIGEIPEESSYPEESINVGGALELEPPEITNPYDDVMGDVELFDIDIKSIAETDELQAFDILGKWKREHIDYAWQEYIFERTFEKSEFLVEEKVFIDVLFSEDGDVLEVKILPVETETATMGDLVE